MVLLTEDVSVIWANEQIKSFRADNNWERERGKKALNPFTLLIKSIPNLFHAVDVDFMIISVFECQIFQTKCYICR